MNCLQNNLWDPSKTAKSLLFFAAVLVGSFVLPLSGCSKSVGNSGPPTADQVKAFKGGPPSAKDAAEDAAAAAKAAEYRRTHPIEFPSEPSVLPAK